MKAMNEQVTFPLFAVSRLRMMTDGRGVTTLVAAQGCPLRCRMCLNPKSWNGQAKAETVTPRRLYELVRVDDLYFQATGGGITFGGGEPLMYPDFIESFASLCRGRWRILAETSLNVPQKNVAAAARCVDEFIVDIKDMNPEIYRRYTGADNAPVISNLKTLLTLIGADRILVRVPLIPKYNTSHDVRQSISLLKAMGCTRFDCFEYTLPGDREV